MDDITLIKNYINRFWLGKFTIKREVSLNKLFPKPKNKGLKHIWKYGHADLSVFKNGKLVCIIEPGGSHHWDEHQRCNDRRKYILAKKNNVTCFFIMNGVFKQLSNTKRRNLLGTYLF